jgi:hypothetical protein
MARTLQPELMDSASAADVALNLRDLSRINRWFGGNRALAKVLDPYLRRYPRARFVALDQAERLLRMGSGPRVAADVFAWPVLGKSVDIVLCSLFLHHFTDADIGRILANFEDAAREAVVAVDLHRHPLSRGFLPATRFLAGWHPMTVHDGVISVDAAFTPSELRALAPRGRVRSHWPWFRLSLELEVNRPR